MTCEIHNPSPCVGVGPPTPLYPPRPGGAFTFAGIPPINVPTTLRQIQLSLTALHERLTTLERTQAMLVRREDRKRGWFWTSTEEDKLDQLEDEADRASWATRTNTRTGVRRRKGLSFRVVWWLLTAVRRAIIDVGSGHVGGIRRDGGG